MGIVDEAIDDDVGIGRVADERMPPVDRKLLVRGWSGGRSSTQNEPGP